MIGVSRLEECTRIPAATHVESHLEACRTDSGCLIAVAHLLIKRHSTCTLVGVGATIPARPPGAACAGRHETGRACGTRRKLQEVDRQPRHAQMQMQEESVQVASAM